MCFALLPPEQRVLVFCHASCLPTRIAQDKAPSKRVRCPSSPHSKSSSCGGPRSHSPRRLHTMCSLARRRRGTASRCSFLRVRLHQNHPLRPCGSCWAVTSSVAWAARRAGVQMQERHLWVNLAGRSRPRRHDPLRAAVPDGHRAVADWRTPSAVQPDAGTSRSSTRCKV